MSVLEFALVVPILLTLMLGILQYGFNFWALETASATAREAVRKYAVGFPSACVQDVARADGRTAALGTITVSPAPTAPKVGDIISVTVSFSSLNLRLFPLPNGGAISQTARARVENVPAIPLTC